MRRRGSVLTAVGALVLASAALATAAPGGRASAAPGGRASAASPAPGSSYVADAGRVGDTRTSGLVRTTSGAPTVHGSFTGLVRAHLLASTPTDATAAVLEVTALAPSSSGFIQVGPGGGTLTTAINDTKGASQTALVVTAIGGNRSVDLDVVGTSGLVVDEVGYDTPGTSGSTYTAIAPDRVLDTRTGTGGPSGPQHARFTGTLPASIPAGATVIAHVTAVAPTGVGFLQAGPTGGTLTTIINYGTSQTGLAYVATSPSRQIDLLPSTSTYVVVDVVGYLRPSSGGPGGSGGYVQIAPHRVEDTRPTPVTGATAVTIGLSDVPSTATGAAVEVSTVAPAGSGFVRLGATGGSTAATVLNVTKGQSLTTLAITRLSSDHRATVDLEGFSADVVVDVVGYFTGPPDTTAPGPVTAVGAVPAVAFDGTASETLSWTNPSDTDDADTVVRRAVGSVAPASVTAGTAVATVSAPARAVTDPGLTGGTTYSYAAFAQDDSGNTAPAATVTLTAKTPGRDESSNTCGSAYPSTALFGIVNPTQGFAFSDPNPCLSPQDAWAHATGDEAFYLPLADRGTASSRWPLGATGPKACPSTADSSNPSCAYDYGYDQAQDAYATASSTGHQQTTWWLDVEYASPATNWNDATGAQPASQNAQVLSGAVVFLASQHATVGVYSTAAQWSEILGSYATSFTTFAEWYAAGTSDTASYCAMPFGGGVVTQVQALPPSTSAPDLDYRC